MELYKLLTANLQMFATNKTTDTTATTGNDLSVEMKTYYSDYLIDLAEPELVHDQFGQKKPIPRNGGKTIEFRKYDSLPKALTPLTEGVTPSGSKLNVTNLEATVAQYGDYVELSDVLLLTAIDNNLVQATQLLGSQAGRTLDTVTREVLAAGTNVLYAKGGASRAALIGGSATASENNICSVQDIKKAVRILKKMNTPKINGWYVGIIHPDVSFDLMNDPEWMYPHQYQDTANIYNGEIGRIAGVRFVETTEAKIFSEAAVDKSSGAAVSSACDVYATLILGANAYGVTEVTGGGLQHIVKQLGSSGTADPLNQRATVGWKAIKTAEILVQQYMVRIESTSTWNDIHGN